MRLFDKKKIGNKREITVFGIKFTYHKKVVGNAGKVRRPPLVGPDGAINARELFFRQRRFDLIFKYVYLKNHRRYGGETDFFLCLYCEHIRAFNHFYEDDVSYGVPKQSKEDFLTSFADTWNSLSQNGFDKARSRIPVGENYEVINGAHRLAACALLNQDVYVEQQAAGRCDDFLEFQKKGIDPDMADFAALEYVKFNPDAYIVNLHSVTDPQHDGRVEEILNRYGFIYYKKKVHMTFNGYINLKKLSYGLDNWKRESWIGGVEDDFSGAKEHARRSMGEHPLRVFVFVCPNLDDVVQAKKEIRDIYGIGNHSIHINDTSDEALELAQTYFNRNSLFVINTRPYDQPVTVLDGLIVELKKQVRKDGIEMDAVCAAGSTPLSVLGLRESSDLDFLYCGDGKFEGGGSISNHDSQLGYYPYNKTEIIQNPEHHFYYRGLKFITPAILLQMKKKRGEVPKDIRDCELIERFFAGSPVPIERKKRTGGFKVFRKIKNGGERTIVILGLKIKYRKKSKRKR
ncbi:MAG: hypothetical protein LBD01_01200 [Puniceicoccales bacterium]|jgi:hypothetical protein|nr:hypothetical protein [Puniceicoccales bacterium]